MDRRETLSSKERLTFGWLAAGFLAAPALRCLWHVFLLRLQQRRPRPSSAAFFRPIAWG